MAIESTPHPESQQNTEAVQSDLEPNQMSQDAGRGGDPELYANSDGAQMGMNRSERVTSVQGPKHKVEAGTSAETGAMPSQIGDAETQGVTNHSQHAEHAGQERVMKEREGAGLDAESEDEERSRTRDSVQAGGELPSKKAGSVETVEISAGRAIR